MGFHCYLIFFGAGLIIKFSLVFDFWFQFCLSRVRRFSLDLVQRGAWLSGWSSFLLVILLVFEILLLELASCNGSFLGLG